MQVNDFTCEGRYVRLILRPGRKPLAYHPGTRERINPMDLRFGGRVVAAPPGALGPRPVVLSVPLIQCWLPEEEWQRWCPALMVPAGQRAVLARIEEEILKLEAESNFEDLLIDPDEDAGVPPLARDGAEGDQARPASYRDGGGPEVWGDLPELEEGEVEIVSILMHSTMGDVISVRARTEGGSIHYRVVDEYEEPDAEGKVISRYTCAPEESSEPLTLGEVKALLWSIHCDSYGQIFEQAWDEQREERVSDYENDFYELFSDHYEGLQEWLEDRFRQWKCQHD